MAAIRCRHCGGTFPIGPWDLLSWRRVPELLCPHCGKHMQVSGPASLLTSLSSMIVTGVVLLVLRRAMDADGNIDGLEIVLFFVIGFCVAILVTFTIAHLVHSLFGTFVAHLER